MSDPHRLNVADSDDDEDDLVIDGGGGRNETRAAAAGTDTNVEQGTGSTERLQKQIRSVERGLFDASGHAIPAAPSSGSPALQRHKRRHTVKSPRPMSPAKRSMTYAAKSTTRDDDGPTPVSVISQSGRPEDLSSAGMSTGLAAGSVGAGFLNHDPIMFGGSGSTIAENPSSQLRALERARNEVGGHPPGRPIESDDDKTSSPLFTWTASTSERTQPDASTILADAENEEANETIAAQTAAQASDQAHDTTAVAEDSLTGVSTIAFNQAHDTTAVAEDSLNGVSTITFNQATEQVILSAADLEAQSQHKKHRSPRVEIPVPSLPVMIAIKEGMDNAQTMATGHKRKVPGDSSEQSYSDDKEIGLPRERYVPRPSKRRATQAAVESIDYSVAPEKAAKARRTKTASAAGKASASAGAQYEAPQPEPTTVVRSAARRSAANIDNNTGNSAAESKPAKTSKVSAYKAATAASIANDEAASKSKSPASLTKQPPDNCIFAEPSQDLPISSLENWSQGEASAKQLAKPLASSAVTKSDDAVFVKPSPKTRSSQDIVFAKPLAKPPSASKVRRSHTTIFEDHVRNSGSKKSPSLTQQQAKRKAALQDLNNEAEGSSQRKRQRRSIVQDEEGDDNDDDESAVVGSKAVRPAQDKGKRRSIMQDDDDEDEPAAIDSDADSENAEIGVDRSGSESDLSPKKRGRGRASKRPTAQSVDDNSAPKKKDRGRQPKNVQATVVDDAVGDHPASSETLSAAHGAKVSEKQGKLAPTKSTAAIGSKAPTCTPPSPLLEETSQTSKAATSQQPTAKAGLHSPIKGSSGVPLRVGLSKRTRIQPLLRIMKPPK